MRTDLQWYRNAKLEVMNYAGHHPMDETPVAASRRAAYNRSHNQ